MSSTRPVACRICISKVGSRCQRPRGTLLGRVCRLGTGATLLAIVALVCGCNGAGSPPTGWGSLPSDLTFFVTSDTHFTDAGCPNPARAAIQAMNTKVIGQPNPAEPGSVIETPSFVVTCGDLADGGAILPATDAPNLLGSANYTDEWNGFNAHFPLTGVQGDINKLPFPNYATGGNHDHYRLIGTIGTGTSTYVAERLCERHAANVTDSGNVYYSFDANGVHVVMLGRWADETVCRWLQDDLRAVGPNVPVVLCLHYSFNDGQLWWTDAERQKLADAITGYRIVAIVHGHTHVAQIYRWKGYDCFDDGTTGKKGEFGVMHITASSLSYAEYRATYDASGNWTGGAWTHTFRKAL